MKTIWKFPINSSRQLIDMPETHRILCADMQGDVPTVWAEVDPSSPIITKDLAVVGTGHEVPEGFAYVGTGQARGFVWHIYVRDYP